MLIAGMISCNKPNPSRYPAVCRLNILIGLLSNKNAMLKTNLYFF